MRLVQLVTRLQRRGAEVFACQLSDELTRRGHDVALVGLYAWTGGRLTPGHARAVDLGGHRRPLVSPSLLQRLMEELGDDPPDLVQANGSDTLKYAALAKRRLDARWPLVYRNISMASTWARHPHQRLWNRWLRRGIDRVVSVSAASARDFARTYGMEPTRIVTIPRGIVCGEIAPREVRRQRLAAEAGVDTAGPMLVHVGSFTPEKNHRWLIEAFARVVKQRPDACLILIGEGPLMSEVRAVIGQRELGGRVRLLGSRHDADDLAGGGDVLLLPSLIEGLPGVVLEAAAREVPTIACDVGGVSEAIEDGRTGFLVPSGDLDAFVERIAAMLDAPEQARRMGVAARAHVCARFDLPSIVDAFESLYRELVPWAVGSASSI